MEIRLLLDKLTKCQRVTETCLKKQKVQLHDLQSVIGTLKFSRRAVVPGRLIDLIIGVARPQFYVCITEQVREDLNMWFALLSAYNGKSLLLPECWLLFPDMKLFTDASGSHGFGATLGPQWFCGTWDEKWRGQPITLREFYPIFLAINIWAQT